MGKGTLEDLTNLSQSHFGKESCYWDGTGSKECWGRSGLSKAHTALPKGAKCPGGETVQLINPGVTAPRCVCQGMNHYETVLSNIATHLTKQGRRAAFG